MRGRRANGEISDGQWAPVHHDGRWSGRVRVAWVLGACNARRSSHGSWLERKSKGWIGPWAVGEWGRHGLRMPHDGFSSLSAANASGQR